MRIKLYEPFQKWYHGGTIWIISDTHFQKDEEMEQCFGWPSAEERLAALNKCVTKNDTLIHLGDVGNRLDLISKIKCNYKVLITGNHDAGNTNYQRRNMYVDFSFDNEEEAKMHLRMLHHTHLLGDVHPDKYITYEIAGKIRYQLIKDTHLFDEVYNGPLFVNDKLLLSHEEIELPFVINIHGHHHCAEEAIRQNALGGYNINCASDVREHKPVRLDELLEVVPQNRIKSIHEITVEKATEKKK